MDTGDVVGTTHSMSEPWMLIVSPGTTVIVCAAPEGTVVIWRPSIPANNSGTRTMAPTLGP